jgi:hypothetical protein
MPRLVAFVPFDPNSILEASRPQKILYMNLTGHIVFTGPEVHIKYYYITMFK